MSTWTDIAGQKYGRLLAVRCVGTDKRGNALWQCVCDCDPEKTVIISAHRLKTGHTKSCGCLRRENPGRTVLITELPTEEIKALYKSGKSIIAVGQALGVGYQTVRNYLRAEGIIRGRGESHRSDVFELAEQDGISRQTAWFRLRKTAGKLRGPANRAWGKAKGEEHGLAKLTWEQAREIRALYATGRWTLREIGKMFAVTAGNISCIVRKKTWWPEPECMIDNIPVWGPPDEGALSQIKTCAQTADKAALMADHHKGYAVPIGGVVAYKDSISPSGVGYDIACGNKAVLAGVRSADKCKSNYG